MRTLRSLMTLLITLAITLMFTGCGSDGAGTSAAGSSSVSSLSAREVAVNADGTLTLVHMVKPKPSVLSLFIASAYAALFVDIEPYFSTNMAAVSITDDSCSSRDGSSVVCDDNGTLTEAEVKEQVTIFPLVSYANDGGNETASIVTLVEDKFYHLTVMRRGGGIPSQTITSVTAHADCPFSISANNGQGDIIIKTSNSIDGTADAVGGSYLGLTDAEHFRASNCKLSIAGTFEGFTFTKTFALTEYLDVGDLVSDPNNEDDTLYPGITEITFDNQSITGSSVSINYQDFTEEADGYRYGEWEIVESGSGTSIEKSFWLFSHGNGGLQKWLATSTNGTTQYYDTDTYSKCSGACPADVIDPYGNTNPEQLYFPWQVGTSGEMLMLVSSIDSNKVMVQKKVAITAE